jgi:hypothetical protein
MVLAGEARLGEGRSEMEAACLATPRIPAEKMWGAMCASGHGIPGREDPHVLWCCLCGDQRFLCVENLSFSERLVRHACHRSGYDPGEDSLRLGIAPMGAVKAWHVAARATRARTGRKAIAFRRGRRVEPAPGPAVSFFFLKGIF